MDGREFWQLGAVSNEELEAGLNRLLGAGARLEARVVAHLAEVDARRWHLLVGCSSLYDYCRKRLGLSDYEAFTRIAVARIARKYPIVFGMLERRKLNLTAICEVRGFLTAENHLDLLEEVSGQTKLQIREILARRFPEADIPANLKKLPALDPLSPGRYRLLLTLNTEQKEKLELARDLLSHANWNGDLALVVERALDELIERLEKRRFGQTRLASTHREAQANKPPVGETQKHRQKVSESNSGEPRDNESKLREVRGRGSRTSGSKTSEPKKATQTSESNASHRDAAVQSGFEPKVVRAPRRRKHIANAVRSELLARDGGRCTFVGCDGTRCDARAFLQFHHRQAWAHGGGDTEDNLTLLCSAHNRLLAEQDFGQSHIDGAVAGRTSDRATCER
jgi:HNH endonuclease